MCHLSHVTCPPSLTQTVTAADPLLGNSTIMQSRVVCKDPKNPILVNPQKSLQSSEKNPAFYIPNIINLPFDQRSLVHRKASFSRCDRQTHIQTDITTYWLNRPRDQFSEKGGISLPTVYSKSKTFFDMIYRPCVAWAVLQTVSWFLY